MTVDLERLPSLNMSVPVWERGWHTGVLTEVWGRTLAGSKRCRGPYKRVYIIATTRPSSEGRNSREFANLSLVPKLGLVAIVCVWFCLLFLQP